MTHDVDLVGLERLEAFAERIPGFTWSACVASADSDYPRKGYVTEHIAAQHLYEGDVDIYLCGPPPMVEAVERYLREQACARRISTTKVRRQRGLNPSEPRRFP